uniref:Uncharacterized protein n=1 Tax=Anguilla anguilla TaxID=7936 RepID=A0A0E9UZR2_ANGAN
MQNVTCIRQNTLILEGICSHV